jgi:hypothetical protein
MSEYDNDILDDIKQIEEPNTRIDDIQTFVLIACQWGIFISLSYIGDKDTQMQGILLLVCSILAMAFSWMYPGYKAAIIAGSRIYLKATVYHGTFFNEKQFEVIDAPKVVASMDENDITEYAEDLDYEDLFSSLGITNLTDIDIDEKIKDAYAERYRREKERQDKKRDKANKKWRQKIMRKS